MNKLLVLFVFALSLTGFNSSSFAVKDGSQSAAATEHEQLTAEEMKGKNKANGEKKKGETEEEPECE